MEERNLIEAEPALSPESSIEALLFSSNRPVITGVLKKLTGLNEAGIKLAIESLNCLYRETGRVFEIANVANGYQMRTKKEYAPIIHKSESIKIRKFTRAALETLSIIAFKQPITRPEIEQIRSVDCGHVVRSLLDKDLIRISGKNKELPGRPMLFSTTDTFLEIFGFRNINDLPNPYELEISDTELLAQPETTLL